MRRTSTRLLVVSAALAIAAVASAAHLRTQRREFSAPTTVTMGTVVKKGAFLGKRRRSSSELFCWVSYEFTPADGVARRNWRLWEPGCGVSPGRPIAIQHVVANPDVNRPNGSEPWAPAGLFFFAAGVTVVIAIIVRRSEQSEQPGSRGLDL
jgi:hypothetical protein